MLYYKASRASRALLQSHSSLKLQRTQRTLRCTVLDTKRLKLSLSLNLFITKKLPYLCDNYIACRLTYTCSLQNVENDPTLFCTAYKKNRFFLFTRREAQEIGGEVGSSNYCCIGVNFIVIIVTNLHLIPDIIDKLCRNAMLPHNETLMSVRLDVMCLTKSQAKKSKLPRQGMHHDCVPVCVHASICLFFNDYLCTHLNHSAPSQINDWLNLPSSTQQWAISTSSYFQKRHVLVLTWLNLIVSDPKSRGELHRA